MFSLPNYAARLFGRRSGRQRFNGTFREATFPMRWSHQIESTGFCRVVIHAHLELTDRIGIESIRFQPRHQSNRAADGDCLWPYAPDLQAKPKNEVADEPKGLCKFWARDNKFLLWMEPAIKQNGRTALQIHVMSTIYSLYVMHSFGRDLDIRFAV